MENDSGETRYWYGAADEDRRRRAIEVLQAFRVYRAAEVAMRRRTRESMSMGENELLVLRYLLRAAGQKRQVSPSELTRYLGVSTASTTAIVDRLEKTGHVTRVPHPTDRRSIFIVATTVSDDVDGQIAWEVSFTDDVEVYVAVVDGAILRVDR